MDNFTKGQLHKIGIGGIECTCCNNKARRGHGKVDKKLNRVARARVKAEAQKVIAECTSDEAKLLDEYEKELSLYNNETYF